MIIKLFVFQIQFIIMVADHFVILKIFLEAPPKGEIGKIKRENADISNNN